MHVHLNGFIASLNYVSDVTYRNLSFFKGANRPGRLSSKAMLESILHGNEVYIQKVIRTKNL